MVAISEHLLHDISQSLRLLARADVQLTRDGRPLAGSVNARLESLRLHIQEGLESLQDSRSLAPYIKSIIAGQAVIESNRQLLSQLRRQLEREMQLAS